MVDNSFIEPGFGLLAMLPDVRARSNVLIPVHAPATAMPATLILVIAFAGKAFRTVSTVIAFVVSFAHTLAEPELRRYFFGCQHEIDPVFLDLSGEV